MRTVHMFGNSSHSYQSGEPSSYLSRRTFPPLPQPRLQDFAPPLMSETTPPSFLSLPSGFGPNNERQMVSSASSSSPSSSGNVLTSLTPSHSSARMSGHMTSPNGNALPNNGTNGVGGNLLYPPGGITGSSGLNHQTTEHIGGGSSTSNSNLPSTSSSFLNRPDSLCSNSNDSGLSDVNCGYGTPGEMSKHHQQQSSHHLQSGMIDGRPKIWSLAHVATSEASSYMSNGHHHLLNGNSSTIPGGGEISGSINNIHHPQFNNNNNMNKAGMIGGSYGLPHPPPSMLPPGTGSGGDSGSGYPQRPMGDQNQGQDIQHHGPNSCPSPSSAYPPPPPPPSSMDNQWPGLYSSTSSSGPPRPPPSGMMGGAYGKQAPPPSQSSMYSHHLNSSMNHMGGPSGSMIGMQGGQIPSDSSPPAPLYGQQPLAGGQQGGGY